MLFVVSTSSTTKSMLSKVTTSFLATVRAAALAVMVTLATALPLAASVAVRVVCAPSVAPLPLVIVTVVEAVLVDDRLTFAALVASTLHVQLDAVGEPPLAVTAAVRVTPVVSPMVTSSAVVAVPFFWIVAV